MVKKSYVLCKDNATLEKEREKVGANSHDVLSYDLKDKAKIYPICAMQR